nr:PH domain-containing protein [Tessaracoccus sp. OS52]
MLSLGYSRLWADEDGVTIRNGPVLRKFRIDEIAGLRLRQGDAWAYLLIKHDGGVKRRAVLAIQSLEGANAKSKMRQLRHWLKANGANSQGVTLEQEPDQP